MPGSAQQLKRMVASHGWLGISLGAVLYLICLTGTVLVFMHEIERWEQPGIDEFEQMPVAAIDTALQTVFEYDLADVETLWIVLPKPSMPRAHVSFGEREWYLDRQGNLTETPDTPWLEMLGRLHYYLHLPSSFGMMVVGAFGVMLLALVISGVLGHPNIIRDAFSLRRGRSDRLALTDLHNRLSVWGLPFSIMIALTGAFIGLVSILAFVAAGFFFDGDKQSVIEAVYGDDPVLSGQLRRFDVQRAMRELQLRAPEVTPIYFAFQHPGTDRQYLEIAATVPNRLVYSEIYRFSVDGEFINHQGLSDGPAGRQVAYSVYRLHFGSFAGFGVKLLYAVFGLALSIACVSGINLWFAKRPQPRQWHQVWEGLVWGVPAAMLGSALVAMLVAPTFVSVAFWVQVVAICVLAARAGDRVSVSFCTRLTLGFFAAALGLLHLYLHRHELSVLVLVFDSVLFAIGMGFLLFPSVPGYGKNNDLASGA